ncbi:MAG: efflux RND transporter periplasmic adaptor subunit [Ktedonobacteraceae bacterium]
MLESQQKSENKNLDLPSFHDDDDDLDEENLSGQKKSRRRGWIISISIVLLLIILIPIVFFTTRGLRRTQVQYQSQQVRQGNFSLVVSATGPVQGTIYNADFLATGKISEIDVKVGQYVKAGWTLAKLDPTALQDALNQAKATLQQQEDFGNQDAINIAQAQVNTAQDNLNNATLLAPHDGAVTAINGAVGGTPGNSVGSAGASGTSGFITIVDSSSLQIQANVNESDIGGVKVGQGVQFTVSAYGTRTFNGSVSAISPLGQSVSNVVTYPVPINVNMKSLQGANVLPGMTANVSITTATHSNVLLIPVDAVTFAQSSTLIPSGDRSAAMDQARQMLANLQSSATDVSKDNPTAGYVLERVNSKWAARPIVLGLTDGTSYEVLAGLTQGETIVVGVQNNSGTPPSGTPSSGGGGRGVFGG